MFADMVQAVELLYFVTDIHNEPRKKGGGPAAELIFREVSDDSWCEMGRVEVEVGRLWVMVDIMFLRGLRGHDVLTVDLVCGGRPVQMQ